MYIIELDSKMTLPKITYLLFMLEDIILTHLTSLLLMIIYLFTLIYKLIKLDFMRSITSE